MPDAKIVITNSKVKHSLVDGQYNKRREECAEALAQLQTVVDIQSLGELDNEGFEKYKDVITDEECKSVPAMRLQRTSVPLRQLLL